LAANPIPGLEIVLAYTFINAEVTKDNVIPLGTPLQGVPTNSFSAWVNFNNVLNSRYFVGSFDEVYVLPGAPFNVLGSFTSSSDGSSSRSSLNRTGTFTVEETLTPPIVAGWNFHLRTASSAELSRTL
jgi:hypothetical protein